MESFVESGVFYYPTPLISKNWPPWVTTMTIDTMKDFFKLGDFCYPPIDIETFANVLKTCELL
jgi:hypothetical protein